jgi:hypothetical protein
MHARHSSTRNQVLLARKPQLSNRVAKAEDAPHIFALARNVDVD